MNKIPKPFRYLFAFIHLPFYRIWYDLLNYPPIFLFPLIFIKRKEKQVEIEPNEEGRIVVWKWRFAVCWKNVKKIWHL